jgi:ferredoxin
MKADTHSIRILDHEKIFFISDDKHLGTYLKPEGCHGGGCGICKIKIISGEVRVLSMSKKHVSEEEKEKGFTLACRVFPLTNLVIENIEK